MRIDGIRWGRPAPWLAALGLLGTVATVVGVLFGTIPPNEDGPFLFLALIAAVLAWGIPAALIGRRRPENPIGLLLSLEASLIGVVLLADQVAKGMPGSGFAAMYADLQGYLVTMLLIGPLILLLFPEGRPPSRRWNVVGWMLVISAVSGAIGLGLAPEDEVRWSAAASLLTTIAGFVGLGASAMAIASVVVRFRRSRGSERAQIRWLAIVAVAGALFFVGTAAAEAVLGQNSHVGEVFFDLLLLDLAVGLPAAIGVAVLRYRLLELDVVVKKAFVALALTAILGLPVLAVLGLMSLLLLWTTRLYALIGGVAIGSLIVPITRLARRIATRLTYGSRASQYEVLTAFGERVVGTYSVDDVLPRMVQVLADGTGATSARILLRVGSELRQEAATGEPSGEENVVPVLHLGEELGALTATFPPSDPIDAAKQRLMENLAAQAGLVLRNVKLIEELRASRQRLVAAQDEERRKIERNIHDGAQQQLVALSVQLKLLGTMVEREPQKARELADDLGQASTRALEDLRDLARGIYPPLLADKGLGAALGSQARKAAVPTSVEADGIGRYPAEVESAVYFCALEALNNVAKYARATHVDLALAQASGHLSFVVRDDGIGFDTTATSYGTGMQGMADRLDAIGGALEIRSTPGEGTVVAGRVPVR